MFFYVISCCFQQFFTIPAEIKNTRLKLALDIPTGASITVANYGIEMLPLLADKIIKNLSK